MKEFSIWRLNFFSNCLAELCQPLVRRCLLLLLAFSLSACTIDLNVSSIAASINAVKDPNANAPVTTPLKVSLSSNLNAVKEGDSFQFFVNLNRPSDKDVEFTYTTQSGSALENVDYVPFQGKFTIPAGQTTVIILIPTITRSGYQGDRVFDFAISDIVGAPTPTTTKETAVIKEVQTKPGLLIDINRTPDQIPVATMNGFVYFVNFQEATGFELWKTNGTTTSLVKDINPGALSAFSVGSNNAQQFKEMNGFLYFGAVHKDYGLELWRTDGTDAGTTLVADITPGPDDGLAYKELIGTLQNKLYFTGYTDYSFYYQLYSTDGTAAGTAAVKTSLGSFSRDTSQRSTNGSVILGSKLFYAGYWYVGWSRNRVLATDGTNAGTFLLKDTNTGGWKYSDPVNITLCNNKIFFGTLDSYNESPTGDELWVSDGTTAGTSLVKDIVPGASPSYAAPVGCVNNKLIFRATTAAYGEELWVSDGTSANTILLADINPGASATIFSTNHGNSARNTNFITVGNTLYFFAKTAGEGFELWKTDGTSAGTTLVKDIFPGTESSYPHNFANVNGTLAFVANDGNSGYELWRSDGTEAGTQMVMDLNVGPAPSSPENLVVVPGANGSPDKLFMTALNSTTNLPTVVWTQLTSETTVIDDSIVVPSEDSSPNNFFSLGQSLFFQADDGNWGEQIWTTDGTPEGTKLFTDLYPNSGCINISVFNSSTDMNTVRYFTATDKDHGAELWRTDGTVSGTFMVKDIYPGPSGSNASPYFSAGNKFPDGKYLFTANDGVNGGELWVTDGTESGTSLFKNTDPSTTVSVSFYNNLLTPIGGGKWLFWLSTPASGTELWITDGTSAGTTLFKDIAAGTGSAYGTPLVQVSTNKWIFAASGSGTGAEPWVTDGTAAGTVLLKDVYSGAGSGFDTGVRWIQVNGRFIFKGTSSSNGSEYWVSDGTSAGTVILKDIYPGTASSSPTRVATDPNQNFFLFTASDGTSGQELWRTDGTTAGTQMLKDIYPGANGSNANSFTRVNNGWVFYAYEPSGGTELWFTDGTAAGTNLLKDIEPGANSSYPGNFTPLGNKVIFTATTASDGQALWITDGTAAGTTMLKDINPTLTTDMSFSYSSTISNRVYFKANDETHGTELWSTDGTPSGTKLEFDSYPGSMSSTGSFGNFNLVSGTLFFTGTTPLQGKELYLTYPQ